MHDRAPGSRDNQRAREHSAQIRRRNHEAGEDERTPTWRRRAVAGVVLGSMAYLVSNCFFEQRLHKPKIDRAKLRFGHGPRAM